jgi:hypothetical protein
MTGVRVWSSAQTFLFDLCLFVQERRRFLLENHRGDGLNQKIGRSQGFPDQSRSKEK